MELQVSTDDPGPVPQAQRVVSIVGRDALRGNQGSPGKKGGGPQRRFMPREKREALCFGMDLGFVRARGEHYRSGQAIHAQSRDVDLVTAIGRELKGEFCGRAGGNGAKCAPKVDGGGQWTRGQQHWGQRM